MLSKFGSDCSTAVKRTPRDRGPGFKSCQMLFFSFTSLSYQWCFLNQVLTEVWHDWFSYINKYAQPCSLRQSKLNFHGLSKKLMLRESVRLYYCVQQVGSNRHRWERLNKILVKIHCSVFIRSCYDFLLGSELSFKVPSEVSLLTKSGISPLSLVRSFIEDGHLINEWEYNIGWITFQWMASLNDGSELNLIRRSQSLWGFSLIEIFDLLSLHDSWNFNSFCFFLNHILWKSIEWHRSISFRWCCYAESFTNYFWGKKLFGWSHVAGGLIVRLCYRMK